MDHDPQVPINDPPVPLATYHAAGISFSGELAGSITVSGFSYLEQFSIVGTGSSRTELSDVAVRNNPRLGFVRLNRVEAGSVQIAGNPALTTVSLYLSGVGLLNLNAPQLEGLIANSLGTPAISLANFPELRELRLYSIHDLGTLDLSACTKLTYLELYALVDMTTLRLGAMPDLHEISLEANWVLTGLDLRTVPNLVRLDGEDNYAVGSLLLGNKPALNYIYFRDSALTALDLRNLPELVLADFGQTEHLGSLLLGGDPKLFWLNCSGCALPALDVSGAPGLTHLYATGNRLTEFDAPGLDFVNLYLLLNPLQRVSATIAGRSVQVAVQAGGGTVALFGGLDYNYPDLHRTWFGVEYDGLDEPYTTELAEIAGTGLPDDWDGENVELTGDVDLTFKFSVKIALFDYYATPAQNPFGQYLGCVQVVPAVIGEPLGAVSPPPHPGFELKGWFSNEDLTQPWDLENDPVPGYLVLFPDWQPLGAPVVRSVRRHTPEDEFTTATTVRWRVRFTSSMSGIDVSDFVLTRTGTANGTISAVSAASGIAVDVTVSGVTGSGTLRLDVKPSGTGIVDGKGTPLAGGYTTGDPFTVGTAAALANFLEAYDLYADEPDGAADADPDGDGVNNLLEFVLGGDPSQRNDNLLPSVWTYTRNGALRLEYDFLTVATAEAACRLIVESSTNLTGWAPAVAGAGGVEHTVQTTGGLSAHAVTFPATGGRLFVRLRVEPK